MAESIAVKPMSLYQVMGATGVGGWDAAQELKRMVRDRHATTVISGGATCYVRTDAARS